MQTIPNLFPISELRQQQNKILQLLSDGPVVLTQHGRASVVLVSPELWNQMVNQVEDLLDALDAVEVLQNGESTISFDEYIENRGKRVQDSAGE
jgi:prevent-host-death family protein